MKTRTEWSFEVIAPSNHNVVVYHCPDVYVSKRVCEEVAKTCISLVFPSCDYKLIPVLHSYIRSYE